jgi:glycosyltransferase involved in cell wall biosynthesis
MAAEIPVLCFDKGTGAVDAVGDEGGYIVPYLDITAMAKKLVHLYQNDDERKRMGQRNKSVIEQDYSFEQYVMKIHERILKNYLD